MPMSALCLQLKEEIELRKQMNLAELNDLDEVTRIEIEGFRTGTYVRLEIHAVPYEMVEYFDPCHPILVGGINLGEDNIGYMQVNLSFKFLHQVTFNLHFSFTQIFVLDMEFIKQSAVGQCIPSQS